jgi:hypothetical protein
MLMLRNVQTETSVLRNMIGYQLVSKKRQNYEQVK